MYSFGYVELSYVARIVMRPLLGQRGREGVWGFSPYSLLYDLQNLGDGFLSVIMTDRYLYVYEICSK